MDDREHRYPTGFADLDDLTIFTNGQARAGEYDYLCSNHLSGLKSMPVTFTAER